MSQSSRILAVLSDGKPHSVPEIHERAGTCRLNSRIAELRTRGHEIVCARGIGNGAAAYSYQLRRREPHEDASLPETPSPVFVGAFTTAGDASSVAEQQLTLLGSASGDGAPYASSESRAAA